MTAASATCSGWRGRRCERGLPTVRRMETEDVQCSAKGCRAPARHVLVWNNPKIHTPDREKTWVACDEHRQSLSQHLDVRGFLKRVDALPVQT